MSDMHTDPIPVELLYIWTENDETGFIEEQGFNFSPHYRFELKAVEDGQHYELTCTRDESYPNVWETGNIVNLTAVVGENGSGKSSLLRYLLYSPLPDGRGHNPVNKKREARAKMMKIYRYGEEVLIVHNFPDGQIINRTAYKVRKQEEPRMFISPIEKFEQTCVYMTNGIGAADSIREYLPRGDSVYFSPEGNAGLSKLFFAKTQMLWGRRSREDFTFLQERIAAHNQYRDFEWFAIVSYYHDLLTKERGEKEASKTEFSQQKPAATCSPQITFTLNNPYSWFKDTELANQYNSTDQFMRALFMALQDCGEWRLQWKDKPFDAIWWAFVFELDYMMRCLLEERGLDASVIRLNPDDPEDSAYNLLELYRHTEGCDRYILAYYRDALFEIKDLSTIWFHSQAVHVGGHNRPRYMKPGIGIHRDDAPELYQIFCEYIHQLMRKPTAFVLKYLSISMPPRSSGEQALQNVFAWLRLPPHYEEIIGTRSIDIADNILLLLDEVDLYMHPEWQRQFLKMLHDRLVREYPGKRVQVIISTHSPLVLSDIPSRNIIYLRNDGEKCTIAQGPEMQETFGANLFALLKDSFFLTKSLGDFAYSRINQIIDDLNELKRNPRKEGLRERCRKHEGLIRIIGEPMLRRRLQSLYQEAFPEAPDEHSRYLDEFNRLRRSDDPADREKYRALLAIMGSASNNG